jgi:hypothetical protein
MLNVRVLSEMLKVVTFNGTAGMPGVASENAVKRVIDHLHELDTEPLKDEMANCGPKEFPPTKRLTHSDVHVYAGNSLGFHDQRLPPK